MECSYTCEKLFSVDDVRRMNTEFSEIDNLFTGHTAWFSSSVFSKTRGLWLTLGGTEASFQTADFIFSEDANAPDTLSIFEDASYQKHGLAVIHSKYINACIIAEDMMDVALGDYILYPASIQHFIKQQRMKNICPTSKNANSSTMRNTARNKSPDSGHKTEDEKTAEFYQKKSITPQSQEEDAVHISDLELISGDLQDFIPGKNKCIVYQL